MNIEDTLSFLQMLEPENHETHEFLWHGIKEGTYPLQAYGTAEEMLQRMKERNEEGYGIFVAVNAIDTPAYDDRGRAKRRAEDITRVRAVFADWDNTAKVIPETLPLEPSMVVRTSTGKFHIYWCVESDFPLAEFEGVQRGISQSLGTDGSVVDLPRVMRVPGFLHTKGKPTPVEIVEFSPLRYSAAQIREAFPYDPSKTRIAGSTWEDGIVQRKAAQTAAVIAANYLPRLDGGYNIRCPWASNHTTPDSVSGSTYWPPSDQNGGRGSYVCMHNHCRDRMVDELDSWVSTNVATFLA